MSTLAASQGVGRGPGSRSSEGSANPLLRISNGLVGLYKEAFGRGPTQVRTRFADQDTVVVVLEDALTVAEATLLRLGEEDRVRESRQLIQDSLEGAVRSLVEDALGRRTRAFVTGIDPHHATAMNVLILEPSVERVPVRQG